MGLVCQNYGGLFRRPRGMYFSAKDKGEMMSMIYNWPSHQVTFIFLSSRNKSMTKWLYLVILPRQECLSCWLEKYESILVVTFCFELYKYTTYMHKHTHIILKVNESLPYDISMAVLCCCPDCRKNVK